jgi:hypothetical protein
MTMTTHTAIGAAIGLLVGNPLLGFSLGVASHFLVDMIPHGDSPMLEKYHGNRQQKHSAITFVTLDAGIALALVVILGATLPQGMGNTTYAAAILGSVLPDILVGISHIYKTKIMNWYNRFHFFFHDFFTSRIGDVKLSYALIGQVSVIALILYYLHN